jgi:photosystem II stability/assembly factor-like uncharacterized protein
MYRFILASFITLVIALFLLTSCNDDMQELPVKKITKKTWLKKKKQKELHYEGPHNFFKYHHRIRTRRGDTAPRYTTNYKQKALQKALKYSKQKGIARNKVLNWQERGPGNVGGRTRGLLVDPRDTTHLTWLVGSAGGGIWKTTDAGQNWRLTTEELPNMATTTLASSLANPAIVYAGTGEGFDQFMIKGDGIYKSLDDGENWSLLTETGNKAEFENVLRIVVDPEDPNIVLAATRRSFRLRDTASSTSAPVSYIMKSIDGGATWKAVYTIDGNGSDGSSPAVQQIIADPSNFNTLYASVRGTAILKSVDKGETWSVAFDAAKAGLGRMELAIAPTNPEWLYFGVEGGRANLYRSRDGGANWEPILGNYGNWFGGQGWYDNTIAVHPYDQNTVLVGGAGPLLSITAQQDISSSTIIGEVVNNTDFINLYNPFENEVVLTMEDFARNIAGELPSGGFDELIEVELRFGPGKKQKAHRHLIGEDISSTFVDYVEIPFEAWDVKSNRQLMVSFVDDDDNGIWNINEIGENLPDDNAREIIGIHSVSYNDEQPSEEIASFLNKGYYVVSAGTFEGMELDPQNLPEGTILIPTATEEGFNSNHQPIADGYNEYGGSTKGIHVDHHNIVLIPVDSSTGTFYILNANDGGVAFSKDSGTTFTQTGDTFKQEITADGDTITHLTTLGYNTSQFYGADKMNGADRYVGGTQDNGSWVSPADADDKSVWAVAPSGDGFEAAWNYGNPDLILESSQFNDVYRSTDRGLTWEQVSMPGEGPFITRLEASKQDPDLVFGISSLGVLKSTDFGLNWSVTSMPPEWMFNENPIAVSLASPQVVWTGSAFGEAEKMVVSTDGGGSFDATNGYDQATLGAITGIGTHPYNKNKAYALFSIADGPKILETDDLGKTWKDISGFETNELESKNGFPDVATYALVVMPHDTNQIWVGTEIGLFESLDGGTSWHYADNGLPPVAIFEMKIVNDEVVLATHGRGIWTVGIPELEGYEPITVPIGPQIAVEGGFGGAISGNANLRSVYDSSILEVTLPYLGDNTPVKRISLEGNSAASIIPVDIDVDVIGDTIVEAVVTLTSFIDGAPLTSRGTVLVYGVEKEPISVYNNNFDEGQKDFARLGFNVYQAEGFTDAGLHSPHPYLGPNQEFVAVFQKPIEIRAGGSQLSFDEVVLVEPGEVTDYMDPRFFDFVTIEGTNDRGKTWKTLDAYDSRRNEDWEFAFFNEEQGTADLIQKHQIDLSTFFNPGEVVYLRFRLVSDPQEEGWGWMIDNVEIQSEVTSIEELPASVALKNYPNPFNNSTVLQFTLPAKSKVSAALYSLDGKKVSKLIETTENAGQHQYQINTSSLESGIYFCRFQVNGAEQTLKWVKK